MRVLVTGGGGFLGSAIVRGLRERGDAVRVLGRGDYPALAALGATIHRADVNDGDAVARASEGCDAVVHTAARAGIWGSFESYRRPNVDGTRAVIDACRAAAVPRLVFTGSPSVVFDGSAHRGAGSSLPYAARPGTAYSATKAAAERLVLAANSKTLATVSLRPHLIYGPHDPHLVPRLVLRARAGRLAFVGGGGNRVSLTYIDNAAAAHLQALDALESHASPCAGRAYFVNDPEPVVFREWIVELLAGIGAPPVAKRVPLPLALVIGAALEAVWTLGRLPGEPPLTRFVARNLALDHWYSIDEAVRDFNYAPVTRASEGFRRTVDHFRAASR